MSASEWAEFCLADLCESIDYGYTTAATDIPLGPKFLRITDIVNESINWHSVPYCDIESQSANKYQLKHGDVVIARTGATTGFSAYISKPPYAVFASYLVRLKIGEKANPRFIAYFLKTLEFWDYIRGVLGDKSAQPNASAKTMTQVKLCLPPLPTQHAIARILGSLDDKIELNRQMNETLEAMIRTIFQSWFVDFDPVRAKAEGRDTGLPLEIAALFPEHFEDSEIGEIPTSWKIERFEKILHHSTERIGSGQAVEYSATVTGLTLDDRFNKQLSKTREKNKKIVKGDLVFGLSRKIVNFGLMKGNIGSVSPVYEIFKVNSDIYIPELLEIRIRNDMSNFIDILKPGAREGQGIDREYLLSKSILVSDIRVQKKYFQIYSIFKQKIENNEQESQTLAQIRDALLPKLMSGEIQVEGNVK